MTIQALRYEILRGVSPTSRKPCIAQPSGKPIRVAFLMDESRFLRSDGLMEHHKSVFLEDYVHDWDYRDGAFYYYGRAMDLEDVCDIVVVFEQKTV
jgi:hypothetical protein